MKESLPHAPTKILVKPFYIPSMYYKFGITAAPTFWAQQI